LSRQAEGTVWVDGVEVTQLPFELRGLQWLPGLFGGGGLAVTGGATLPAKWRVSVEGKAGVVSEAAGDRMPIVFRWLGGDEPDYRVQITASDDLEGETLTSVRRIRVRPAKQARGYAAWVENSMVRVLPQRLPAAVPDRLEARIALAGNEFESFQVVLLGAPGTVLNGVTVQPSDLVGPQGARLKAAEVSWQQVGYTRFDKIFHHPRYPEATPGWWPDALLPVERASVPAGFAQPFWITVHVPAGTPPGDYSGKLTIRPEALPPAEVALRVHVRGFDLPVRTHLKTAFALMDGYLEQVYGKPLPASLRLAYGDFLLDHRLNPDDISRTDPPAISDLLHYKARGMNTFNVLNMVEPRGDRTWVCWSPLEFYTPKFKQSLIDRLDPYVAELRRNGLADLAYIYTFDERGEEFNGVIREYFGMVKERYPEIHTLTTAILPNDPKVLADLNVDWNCPLTPRYRLDEAAQCRAAGRESWVYVCLGPRYPYANFLADDPLVEARVIGWQCYRQQVDGFLYWGLNIWGQPHNDKPIDLHAGPLLDWSITTGGEYDWLHGDGRLLYAGPRGPIGSIRLENLRDGIEDYEYLRLLSDRLGQRDAADAESAAVSTQWTDFTRDPAVVYARREAVARRIERAGRPGRPGPGG
ncbi:MAG: DUF4091 domain-containing protein, partial [Armatimonadetes bacterium]|nr:DUF4091 domain-containing protein [Armatimonadota bacterium]